LELPFGELTDTSALDVKQAIGHVLLPLCAVGTMPSRWGGSPRSHAERRRDRVPALVAFPRRMLPPLRASFSPTSSSTTPSPVVVEWGLSIGC
jgi:hypothetical protein